MRERAARGDGPEKIRHALAGREIDADLAADALAAAGVDWGAEAARARCKRFGAAPPRAWGERARQARFLAGRGFTGDQIRAALGGDPGEGADA